MDGNVVDTPPVIRVLEEDDRTRVDVLRESIVARQAKLNRKIRSLMRKRPMA